MAEVTLESLETKVYIIKIRLRLTDSLIKNWIDTRLIKEGHFELSKLLEISKYLISNR